MNINIKLKSAGKRRPVLNDTPYELPENISTLRQLITEIVTQEVKKFNERGVDNMLIPFLTETEIADQAEVGKVGFGRLYNENKAVPEKSVETAIMGFTDGLFKVVVNETDVSELDAPLIIRENDTLTFIRLTFLAGRLW